MINIVGGGPAGSTCAYYLAKNGFNVTLYEKSPNTRKPCGGGLSWKIFNEFTDILDQLRIQITPIKIVHFIFDNKYKEIKLNIPTGSIVDRLIFDRELRRIAKEQGCKIINKEVNIEDLDDIIIDARGFVSSKENALALSSICKLKNSEFTMAYFSRHNKIGYFWTFPISKRIANIGVGEYHKEIYGKLSKNLNWWIKKLNAKEIERKGWQINGYIPPNIVEKINNKVIIRIGERSGLVNPLTSEGIYYAMKSGKILAGCIVNRNLKEYSKFIKKTKIKFLFYKKMREIFFDKRILYPRKLLDLPIKLLLDNYLKGTKR